MALYSTIRLAVLVTALVFSLIVLGISAHLTWFTNTYLAIYFTFAAMSIASAVLTLVSVVVLIAVDLTRKGAFTSKIAVELGWLGVLWVLWLASAGLAADANATVFPSGCGFINTDVDTACKEFAAITAFAFLTWAALMGYTILLFVLSIIAHNRGNPVWYSSVADSDFFARGPTTTAPGEKPVPVPAVPQPSAAPQYTGTQHGQYPVQQQQPQYASYPEQISTPTSAGWAGQPQLQHPAQQPSYPQV